MSLENKIGINFSNNLKFGVVAIALAMSYNVVGCGDDKDNTVYCESDNDCDTKNEYTCRNVCHDGFIGSGEFREPHSYCNDICAQATTTSETHYTAQRK